MDFHGTQQVIEDCTQETCVEPATSDQSQSKCLLDIPVNRPTRIESLSPVLSYTRDNSGVVETDQCDRISPILYPFVQDKKVQSLCGDISDVIETIPEAPSSQIVIEELLTQDRNIDPTNTSLLGVFPSTYSSSASSTSTNKSLNVIPGSNQKAKFKRDGFAQQAIKALKAQSDFRDIWKLEYSKNPVYDAESCLDLYVQDIISETGRCILVCVDGRSTPADICLVLAPIKMNGSECIQTANTLKGCHIRLFQPYSRKFIDYCHRYVCFYYDIVRWLNSNTDSCCF